MFIWRSTCVNALFSFFSVFWLCPPPPSILPRATHGGSFSWFIGGLFENVVGCACVLCVCMFPVVKNTAQHVDCRARRRAAGCFVLFLFFPPFVGAFFCRAGLGFEKRSPPGAAAAVAGSCWPGGAAAVYALRLAFFWSLSRNTAFEFWRYHPC